MLLISCYPNKVTLSLYFGAHLAIVGPVLGKLYYTHYILYLYQEISFESFEAEQTCVAEKKNSVTYTAIQKTLFKVLKILIFLSIISSVNVRKSGVIWGIVEIFWDLLISLMENLMKKLFLGRNGQWKWSSLWKRELLKKSYCDIVGHLLRFLGIFFASLRFSQKTKQLLISRMKAFI